MNYQNLFKIAIRAIAANKMRSFLTALGTKVSHPYKIGLFQI